MKRARLAEAGRVPLFQAIKCRPYGRGEAQEGHRSVIREGCGATRGFAKTNRVFVVPLVSRTSASHFRGGALPHGAPPFFHHPASDRVGFLAQDGLRPPVLPAVGGTIDGFRCAVSASAVREPHDPASLARYMSPTWHTPSVDMSWTGVDRCCSALIPFNNL
jgi:hypothetical protein